MRRIGTGVVIVGLLWAGMIRVPGAPPENFRRENLVAWAIVPYDAKGRGPEARAALLVKLGMRRCAYDWRAEQVPTFEEEIVEYEKQGIEYVAFWSEHEEAFALFEKHGMRPQVWKTLRSPKAGTQAEKVEEAVGVMMPLAEKTKAMGCQLGLYNHGGWGGEPENLVAVCEGLRAAGHDHVGIVYNFHHGHGHVKNFATWFSMMQPYLLCVNLNGMADAEKVDVTQMEHKIMPIGSGEFEREMIEVIVGRGYAGPIGIIGHRKDEDLEVTLRENLAGLEGLLESMEKEEGGDE
jgi:hypothetical protein